MVDTRSRQERARIVSVGTPGSPPSISVWGMTGRERLERGLRRAGAAQDPGAETLFRDDFVYDEVLLRALLAKPGVVLVADDGTAAAAHIAGSATGEAIESALRSGDPRNAGGLQPIDPTTLASSYNRSLRKRAAPYLLRIGTMPGIAIERRMFDGAYKGVTDFVTKRVWPWPAFHVTRLCARLGISPNLVTAVSLVFVLAAMALFWHGQFAIGLACAWAMCFLDTVDGKLARVTLRSTPFGNVFDHGIDLIHPPFWYWAWYEGLTVQGGDSTLLRLAFLLILVGYVGGRLQEGLFTLLFGIEIHIWRPLDSWFREITARRNPNLVVLTVAVLIGQPDWGFIAVAFWSAFCFLFHTIRILQAVLAKATGHAPVSWLSDPAAQTS